MFSRSKGFTILEALASAALLAVGITASMAALSSVAKQESRAEDTNFVQRLAQEKYEELISTNQQALAGSSGDFTDRNLPGYTWNLDVTPSQVSNLDTVVVTVSKQNAAAQDPKGIVESLVYISPNATSTGTATP